METPRLLVVSRDASVLRSLWSMSESNPWQLESAASGWAAMERLQSGVTPHLLLLDVPRGDTDGLHLLRWLRRLRPDLPIMLICDSDDEAKQQEAVRLGARDCLLRPLEDKQLETTIRYHLSAAGWDLESKITTDDIEPIGGSAFFVAASPIMRQLRAQAELLAAADVPVMIMGERGSGKETAARLIHKLSSRSRFNFAKVNCAALPSDLLEAELFGSQHPGNGSNGSEPGKLELCRKGTLLLQEITEMPLALQAKLARVIQQKQFVRPAKGTSCEVDVRFLAANSTSIEAAVSQSKLRQDLYYAFSSYMMHVPPLRQRREDVLHLLHYFKHLFTKQYSLPPRSFSAAVLETCQSHSWPENVNELESFVKRYLMGITDTTVERISSEAEDADESGGSASSKSQGLPELRGDHSTAHTGAMSSLKAVLSQAEKDAIETALVKTGWNRKAAAQQLKVSYRTLLYKIDHYHLIPPLSSTIGNE